jgi:hypothetical protein
MSFELTVLLMKLFYWNKWSYKLYLEGKVQREHFFKNKALGISLSPLAHSLFQNQNQFCKSRENHPAFLCRFKNDGLAEKAHSSAQFHLMHLHVSGSMFAFLFSSGVPGGGGGGGEQI